MISWEHFKLLSLDSVLCPTLPVLFTLVLHRMSRLSGLVLLLLGGSPGRGLQVSSLCRGPEFLPGGMQALSPGHIRLAGQSCGSPGRIHGSSFRSCFALHLSCSFLSSLQERLMLM